MTENPGQPHPPARKYQPGDVANGYVLAADGQWVPVAATGARAESGERARHSAAAMWSFGLGIASVFLADLLLPQLAAITLGIVALSRVAKGGPSRRWMAITGTVLGVIYLVVGFVRYLERAGALVL